VKRRKFENKNHHQLPDQSEFERQLFGGEKLGFNIRIVDEPSVE